MSSILKSLELPSDQDISGRTLGDEEASLLLEALASGILTSTKGQFVKELEHAFARYCGCSHALACSSGTAAVHAAVAAINPEPGEEVITSPVTDMGAITPILYQGAIPVFADVDPVTLNVTADTIERAVSDRTRAIIVTHLFGNVCDLKPILELAASRGIPVISDCAQALGATYQHVPVGRLGDICCFSLQQGKHATCGEGGLVTTNDPELFRRMFLFVNKAWGYGDEAPDHYFLALNYRMSELQGAVALAQLEKLPASVARRIAVANHLTDQLAELEVVATPRIVDGGSHTYWRYALNVDPQSVPGGCVGMGARLRDIGVPAAPRYIQKPAFDCAVIRRQRTFGRSRFPFTLAREEALDYSRDRFPGTYHGLSQILVLPWNEQYGPHHVQYLAEAIDWASK